MEPCDVLLHSSFKFSLEVEVGVKDVAIGTGRYRSSGLNADYDPGKHGEAIIQ